MGRPVARVRQIMYVPLFLLGLLVGLLAGCTTQSISEPQSQFEAMISARVDPDLTVETNHKSYGRSSPISYRVVNRIPKPVYFANRGLGLRVYKFDESSKNWVLVLGEMNIFDPDAVTVRPGVFDINTTALIPASYIPATGTIRLVVIGSESPNNQDSKVAAFTDIEITP